MDTRDYSDKELLCHLLNRADLDYTESESGSEQVVATDDAYSGYVEFRFENGRLVSIHGD